MGPRSSECQDSTLPQISGWTLFTADASDYIVDGTPQSGGLGL